MPEGMVGAVRPAVETLEPPQRPAGQATQPASASGQHAGQIAVVIPKDYVLRGVSRTEGNKGDVVFWNDIVLTETRGRVRLVLDDGSILSVGSGSRLQVIQHDAQSQQTSLQLQYGRVRAEVMKLAQPNSSFEIRTNTAICGVLGTDFFLEADAKKTRLVVFQGKVSFRPIVAGIVAAVTAAVSVGAGQASTAAAGAVTAPASAGASTVTSAMATTAASNQAATTAGTVAATAATRVAVITAATAPPAAGAGVIAAANKTQQPIPPPTFIPGVSPATQP